MVINSELFFCGDVNEYSGVRKIAEKVKKDYQLVFGVYPEDYKCEQNSTTKKGDIALQGVESNVNPSTVLIYGTIGKSEMLSELERDNHIDLSIIREKREVYIIQEITKPFYGIDKALVIAGSDKRGTIYGLFHFSELIGVSPLVNWNHVWPKPRMQITLEENFVYVSKEPSVKYRGFFINDEWPAFGTWANKHFGGMNADCYEEIFELLLRLKGNYLWPAMWDSNFNLDGPGIKNAELADEYGVVMSTSHHEPCMRSGQEYGFVRGADSIYGDAWDFWKNREGITNFWRDGLRRNAPYENVITMGMRGENDTAIMAGASLQDNIQMLRDVIAIQNKLICENVNPNIDEVPRQIVLFTEVEEFFYGNEEVQGLIGDKELEGITLMLSDNNFGSTRTLPSEKMRNHKGGFGMYYHMDMHGGAHSYQWIGSTYLPKVWEQMTAAYEFGVRDIWVVNIGDIGTQEYGLSFFLDLAYDIEKWGGTNAEITKEYTRNWVAKQFADDFEEEDLVAIEDIMWAYTSLLAKRKHEVMNDRVYHPVHFGEAAGIVSQCNFILDKCKILKKKCSDKNKAAFISLLFYPACGTANLMKMWIVSGKNHLYANQNRVEANILADRMERFEEYDETLVNEYMTVDDGKFDGLGLSEHIGFTTWNDEDCKYPQRVYIRPANNPRMIVCRENDEHYLTGDYWRDKPQIWKDALRPDVNEIHFDIACASKESIHYKIDTDCKWLSFSSYAGKVAVNEKVTAFINRTGLDEYEEASFTVANVGTAAKATIIVRVRNVSESTPRNCYLEYENYVSIDAAHFHRKKDAGGAEFQVLAPYGRIGSAIKYFPVTANFEEAVAHPSVEYDFYVDKAGEYNIHFYMSATTPVVFERKQYIGYGLNGEEIQIVNTVEDVTRPFFLSAQWTKEAYSNCKTVVVSSKCKEGKNTLVFYGVSPAVILEKIVIVKKEATLPESYLGPTESYILKQDK